MKKLLLIALIAVLGYFTWDTVTSGANLFDLSIPSYKHIEDSNKKLDAQQLVLDELIDKTYANKIKDVNNAKTDFKYKKQSYDTLAANATDEQLEAAMKEEEFLLDYLWIVVGNYADDNNVKFLMEVKEDDFAIDFDVTGSYISIINFIYDLANDSELRFLIDNIQLEGGSNHDSTTKAKFSVSGVKVITKADEAN